MSRMVTWGGLRDCPESSAGPHNPPHASGGWDEQSELPADEERALLIAERLRELFLAIEHETGKFTDRKEFRAFVESQEISKLVEAGLDDDDPEIDRLPERQKRAALAAWKEQQQAHDAAYQREQQVRDPADQREQQARASDYEQEQARLRVKYAHLLR